MKHGKHFAAATALTAGLTIVVYILLRAIYQLPVAASAEAVAIDPLFEAHFILIAFLFSLVVGFILYSLIVFRRQPDDDTDGEHFHGHTGLEIAWTVVPLGLVVFFGVWGAQLLGDITQPQDDEVTVHVTGQQWSWQFEYPEEDGLSSQELVVPVDTTIRLEMESTDVLHSFWVPEFRVKQDLVPGQPQTLRITPVQTGEYKVRCAEMCGFNHAGMLAPVRVVSQEEFDAWVEEQLNPPVEEPAATEGADTDGAAQPDSEPEQMAAERGEMWYQQFGCSGCHSIDGSTSAGPSWQGLYGSERTLESGETVVAEDEYIRNSILNPSDQVVEGFPQIMPPNFEEQFAAEEEKHGGEIDIVEDLIAFMKTLSDQSQSSE